jgi:hypothetical protein
VRIQVVLMEDLIEVDEKVGKSYQKRLEKNWASAAE